MQSLGKLLQEAVESMTSSHTDDHYCSICGQLVPKKKLMILGVEKIVQPKCICEVEAWEQGVREATDRKQKNEIERRFSISTLGDRFQECRFDTLHGRPGIEKAASLARSYALNFDDYGGDSLLIWGMPGNGKSHLAAAVCHEIKENGKIPVFQSVPELLERIRNTFQRNNKETEQEIMYALRECDLLVLDDIGAEKTSDWVLEVLFRIIDGRYRNKRPTMFTTNFSPTELLYRFMPDKPTADHEVSAKRLHSRILEVSTIVENKATDYRLEVAKARAAKREPDKRRQWA